MIMQDRVMDGTSPLIAPGAGHYEEPGQVMGSQLSGNLRTIVGMVRLDENLVMM